MFIQSWVIFAAMATIQIPKWSDRVSQTSEILLVCLGPGDESDSVTQMENKEDVGLSDAAVTTDRVLQETTPPTQICKESRRNGELRGFQSSF